MPGEPDTVTEFPVPEFFMKRKQVGQQPPKDGACHLAPVESGVFAKLHNLVAHCAVTRYDDGEPRTPGWFTVKTLGSAWVVQVKDPDAAAQLQTASDTLDNALTMADLLLGSEEAPWEPDPFLKARQTRTKKAS